MLFAGCFFDDIESREWLGSAAKILEHELTEQILDDGGHFELSPMYHSIILNDVFDIINILNVMMCNSKSETRCRKLIQPKLWLETMTLCSVCPAYFNDSVQDIAPNINELKNMLLVLGLRCR